LIDITQNLNMKYKTLPFLNAVILASGLMVLLIGIIVLIGWLFDITILKSLNPDYISMKANTAVCFIISGILIILLRDSVLTVKFHYLIRILSITVLIISAINLFEYIFNWNSGIDELLFKEGHGTTATIHPGRMAINTAVCFILISFSILFLDTRYAWRNLVSQFLVLLTGLISVLPQLGYAYDESDLFTFAYQTPMALNTAISFFTLSIGVLLLRPTQGILKLLGSEGPGGIFARRLFPVVFILPVLIIWSRMALKATGLVVDSHYIIAIFIIYGIVFVFAFWKIINTLNESDGIRRKTEEDLKHSEEKFRRMFENAQDVFYQSDTEGKIIEISPSIYRIAGYRREELIGQLVFHFFDDRNYSEIFLNEISKKGEVDDYEIRLRTKSGKYIYTSLSAHLRFSTEGIHIGIEGTLRQIDERKEFEMQLQKAKEKAEETDRLKTAFLHNISHEIRTPLNAILGFGALLSDPSISKEEQESYLGSIQDGSDQLLSIISTLLDISSAEAKVLQIHETSFNVNSTLRSLHKQFLLKTSENSNTLELSIGLNDEHALIRTDSTRLIQIISNLLVNAFKFTSNGKIEFGYKNKDHELEFYVFDSGIGIPSDQHSRIFDSFYQVEGALNRKYGGTGLGLSICKAYVELLGGRIWVTSAPGAGSQFYFTIPFYETLSVHPVKRTEIKVVDIGKEASLIILVVEDNDINFSLIESYLSGQNVKLLKAQNGKEAVDICRSGKGIDIVLMDIRLPVMDGYTAAKLIKELRPGLPVIAQTAYADEKEQYIDSGFAGLLAKPFTKNDLFEILKKNLFK
jgi:PAS domain S-box-containing protein